MNNIQLLTTNRNLEEQVRRLRNQLQFRNPVNYQEKYKKALRSIEEIIRANKQIKDELDALRTMRQADLESFTNIQKEEFKKAYDALLKEKNSYVISLQGIELENQKLKYTISQLENQILLYKNQKSSRRNQERETLNSNQHQQGFGTDQNSPRKSDPKDLAAVLRQKQAEFHRTIDNYEEHHINMTRNNKRLQQRIVEFENKLLTTEKNWRIKLESKELEVIDIKSLTRQQFNQQIAQLRKQNSSLKIANNDLLSKVQNCERNTQFQNNLQNYDWEADLVQEMINVKSNLQPLRQQISELHDMNRYEKEQSVRERTNLSTRNLELESQIQRLNQTIKNLQKKILESHQQKSGLQEKAQTLKRLEEENQLLNGKVIVMESRQIALRNRTGEQLQQRVLQFESRIDLLLNNKEGLRQLRQIGIHQLLALKAYIMELDSKLKELLNSNAYILKKYKSYKEKYQTSLKEQKQYGMSINTLKMKILGYDKLVIKLQTQLERVIKLNEGEVLQVSSKNIDNGKGDLYEKKYLLMKQKLEIQEKYKEQQIQTLKLDYETRIMQLMIKVQEIKSLKETIQLYRAKNQQLQTVITKKESQLFQSKILTNSKAMNFQNDQLTNTRQTKDIISNLHASLKQNDETIFKLQSQLRTKQDTYKRTIMKLERQIEDQKDSFKRQISKKQMDHNLTLDQEIKKYKLKISQYEHNQQITAISHKDQHSKKSQEANLKLSKIEARLQQSQSKRQEEAFTKRKLQKQILDLNHDKEELQRLNNDIQVKISQFRQLQRENEDLKGQIATITRQQNKGSSLEYQLQSKDNIIKKLNNEITQIKSNLGGLGEKDITISSQKNEIFYLKKEIEDLHETINKYNNEITFLKGTLDSNKNTLHTGFETIIDDKQIMISKLRKELNNKDIKIHQNEQEISKLQESTRKMKRQLAEIERLRDQIEKFENRLNDKDKNIEKLKNQLNSHEDDMQRVQGELTYVKQGYQRLSYEILEKDDQISKLQLEINTLKIKNNEYFQSKFTEELIERERQYNKLNSQYLTLKSSLNIVQEDCNYHEQNYKKTNNDLFNLKGHINQLQEENDSIKDQLYYKTQQLTRVQFSIQGYKQKIQEFTQREEEIYKMRNQIFSLKSDLNNLQEEIFNKEAINARLINQNNYIRTQYEELDQQSNYKTNDINRLTYELNSLRSGKDEIQFGIQEKDTIISKLNADIYTLKKKFGEQEEEIEEREQEFSALSQQINKFKLDLTYYQDDIQDKNGQIARLSNEKQVLRSEIQRLNEEISSRNIQINRLKQQIFSMKMQAGDKQYEQKMKIQQQIYSFRNKITSLQHDVEDRESEIRRLNLQIETIRSQPPPTPSISEDEIQQLRNQLGKRQREFINMKFELEDKDYQLSNMNNTTSFLKSTIAQYQLRIESEREQYERNSRQFALKQRKWQEQRTNLYEEIDRKSSAKQIVATPQFVGYSEEEFSQVQQKLRNKQKELNELKYQLEDKLFAIQNFQSKSKMLQNLVKKLEVQSDEDQANYQRQIQQLNSRERQYQRNIEELQTNYQYQLQKIQKISQSVAPSNQNQQNSANLQNEAKIRSQQSLIRQLKSQLTDDQQTYQRNLKQFTRKEKQYQINIQQMQQHYQQQIQILKQQSFKNAGNSAISVTQTNTQYQTIIRTQQLSLRQIKAQVIQDQQTYERQILQYIAKQKQYQKNIQQLQRHYQYQIKTLQQNGQLPGNALPYDHNMLIQQYVTQIDRLNAVVHELEEDIAEFKLKLSSMINQQNRIQENLVTMMLLFTEVEALRNRIKLKQSQINEVRKSFIQMTVAGDSDSNKMSRILALAQNKNTNSEESLDVVEKQPISTIQPFQQIIEVHEHLELSKREPTPAVPPPPSNAKSTEVVQVAIPQEQREQHLNGSLIQQLEKQQSISSSQARGGQITIKIQNPGQYLSQTIPIPANQMRTIQQNYIQHIPNQQIRIQQGPIPIPQQVQMSHSNYAQGGMTVRQPGSMILNQTMPVQQGPIRTPNLINMTPMNVPLYKPLY